MKRVKHSALLSLFVISFLLLTTFRPASSSAKSAGLKILRDTETPVEIIWNPVSHVASFIIATAPGLPLDRSSENSGSPDQLSIANQYLETYSYLFGLKNVDDELSYQNSVVDTLGMSHITWTQVYQGIPVYGGSITVHLASDGVVHAVNSNILPSLKVDTSPKINAEKAGVSTLRDFPRGIQSGTPFIVVYVDSQKYASDQARLAWVVDRNDPKSFVSYRYFVDAEDGKLLDVIPLFIEVMDRKTYDAENGTDLPGILRRDEGDGPVGNEDIDLIHDLSGEVYNYFYTNHQRDSIDNQGHPIVSSAHYGENFLNAGWSGEHLQFIYGDGIIADDVVAHEFTHAVTHFSAQLEYRWQSGALSESFSDIFGAMVDREDWLMGEDLPDSILAGREALRDMANPSRFDQPEQTKDWVETCSDEEGVHTNSGIVNKAYYNIATTIGKSYSEQIFYRALTVYLDSTASLEDARAAALAAAADIHGNGGDIYQAVDNGFKSVGLDGTWNPPINDCTCSASVALVGDADEDNKLTVLYNFRDQVLNEGPGPRWVGYYYGNQLEIGRLIITDSTLRSDTIHGIELFWPTILALVNDEGETVFITEEMIQEADSLLTRIAEGRPSTKEFILREWEKAQPYRFVGWTVKEAWDQLLRENRKQSMFLPLLAQ